MYFLLKLVVFHCYFSLPEGTFVLDREKGRHESELERKMIPADSFNVSFSDKKQNIIYSILKQSFF